MNEHPSHTTLHPRWYRPRTSTWWWLQRPASLLFILREVSSVFVAWFVIFWLLLLQAVGRGELEWRQFLAWAATPGIWLLNVVSFFFVVFHAVTWFNLAPQAMVVHAGRRRVPGAWIAASNYVAWAVVSGLVVWLIRGE